MTPPLPPGQFFGTRLSSWSAGALALSESRYPAGICLPTHAHARAYVCVTLKGGYHEKYGECERECTPSTIVLHPAGEPHSNRFLARGGHLFRVEIDDDWARDLRQQGARLDVPAETHGGPAALIAGGLLREFRTRDSLSALMIGALTLELAIALVRAQTEPERAPQWLSRVRDFLHAHFAEEVRLDDVSREAGVHASHLNRVFRAHHGCSIAEYTRRLRVEEAARQLTSSQRPIAEIALAAGFADQSHLSRVFARISGLSPARYRRMHRTG